MLIKILAPLQEKLDKRYREIHEINYDTSNLKIIAFKTEFGEFLNENRFFKYWSKDKEPRIEVDTSCRNCGGTGASGLWHGELIGECIQCDGKGEYTIYPQLEEYVDGIHFLLSIGIERKYIKWAHALEAVDYDNRSLESLALDIYNNPINSAGKWVQCVSDYLQMGYLVGIGPDDIERAYMEKNKINHKRQDSGY